MKKTINIRSADGKLLGTVHKHSDGQHEYRVRRTRGFAADYADAVKLVKRISNILDKRCPTS